MAVEQISLFIRLLSHNGSSNLDVRWLQETLTECVQKRWLLGFCEKKKDGKKRKRSKEGTKARKEARAETKQNSKGLKDREKERTAAE